MSAVINGTSVRQLDRPAAPDETVSEEDAGDRAKLARLLARMLKDIGALTRRFAPRRLDFEDITVDSSAVTQYRFEHNFGGRVRWWPVNASGGQAALWEHADTDNDTLILVSNADAVVTIRVEEAG